ncbi:MAG: hypothetical protein FWD53_00720 [Phycisphaerales bacterium]|nr:hypothetical protein [Phycisphaerales bacterium]
MDLQTLKYEIDGWIRTHPKVAIKVGIGTFVVLVLLVIVIARRPVPQRWESSETISSKCYYTADEGKTFEVGAWSVIPPYEKGGKTFVRMYRFQDGKNIKIGYFERYTEEALAALMAADEGPAREALISEFGNQSREVKRPGDENWVPRNSDEGKAIAEVMTSEGRGRAKLVFPK